MVTLSVRHSALHCMERDHFSSLILFRPSLSSFVHILRFDLIYPRIVGTYLIYPHAYDMIQYFGVDVSSIKVSVFPRLFIGTLDQSDFPGTLSEMVPRKNEWWAKKAERASVSVVGYFFVAAM